MSFIIKDKNLINELLKIAQVAGAAPQASPDQIKEVAKKLVDNLSSQLNTPSDTFTSTDGDVGLSTKYLVSLPALLNFLENKGIVFNNNKLVIKHASQAFSSGVSGDAAFTTLDPKTQSLYIKYPDVENFQYYIYKDGLIKYLQDLQQKSNDNTANARMLRPYVGRLIKQVESEIELSVPSPDAFDPNTALDKIPDVLDLKSPFGTGNHEIKQSDLASRESFWKFLSGNNISINSGNGAVAPADFNKENDDLCAAVQSLYRRATWLNSRGDKISQMYKTFVESLAKSMNCDLSVNATEKSKDNSTYTNASYVTEQGQLTDNGVKYLDTNAELPLMDDDIDLDRIERFAIAFKNLGIERAAATSDYAIKALTDLKRRYPLIRVQSLSATNYNELTKYISDSTAHGPNPETSASPYVALLGQVLQATQQMLGQLNAMLRMNSSPAMQEYQRDVQDQLDNKYKKNIYALRNFQGQMENAFRQLQLQNKRR